MKTLVELFQATGGGGLAPESPTVNEGASTSGSSSDCPSGGSSRGSGSESHIDGGGRLNCSVSLRIEV